MADVKGLEWIHGSALPFAGAATVEVRTWEDRALESSDSFAIDLESFGVPTQLVKEGLDLRAEASKQAEAAVREFWDHHPRRYLVTPPSVQEEVRLIYDSARRHAGDRLRDWLSRRVITVESREPISVSLPLFLLSAPAQPGCSAEFTTSSSQSSTLGWSVKIGGAGASDEGSVTVTATASFEAKSSQRKLIFLPITVVLETVLVSRGGTRIRGHRIDLAPLRAQRPAPGAMSLDPESKPPRGENVETYPLAKDTTGTTATYGYHYVQSRASNLKLGLPVQGADFGLTSTVTMQSSVDLKFKLRSGTDYQLYRVAEGDGLLWG